MKSEAISQFVENVTTHVAPAVEQRSQIVFLAPCLRKGNSMLMLKNVCALQIISMMDIVWHANHAIIHVIHVMERIPQIV
jgi:hypothetical protein